MSEWIHGALARLGCPRGDLLAGGALDRKEGPGAARGDPGRGGSGLLCAGPAAQRRYSIFFFLLNATLQSL